MVLGKSMGWLHPEHFIETLLVHLRGGKVDEDLTKAKGMAKGRERF